jgi:hypothetical protein
MCGNHSPRDRGRAIRLETEAETEAEEAEGFSPQTEEVRIRPSLLFITLS